VPPFIDFAHRLQDRNTLFEGEIVHGECRDDEAKSGTRKARNADEDAADLAAYWADNPDKWAKLSQSGRQVLSNMMFGSPEAADEAFGNDAR
jgi:hypothetical protein